VDTINQLHAAMKAGKGRGEIEKIMVFLKDYTVSHFRMEEDLMDRTHYPGAAQHTTIHRDLVAQVANLVDKHQKGTLNLTMPVMDFLQDWLTKHIMSEDLQLAEYLRKQNG
jgi:hemerythrin-like metal-binding protein